MKKKKLLSIVAVSALAAAQMTMPALAGGGTVNVDVTTKNAVIRVQVPTKLEVAVDELEIVGDGTQLNSSPFYIKNYSTVPVYVKTTSTVTAGSNVTLKDTKEGVAQADDGKGNAWVAVAAQIEANSYGTIKDLTDTSANVATVDTTTGKAVQEFYLAKSTGETVYTLVDTDSVLGNGVPTDLPSYIGGFIELEDLSEELNPLGTDDDNTAILQGLVAEGDVYAVEYGMDDTSVTKVVSTEESPATYNSDYSYYSAGDVKAKEDLVVDKMYVYAEADAAGGETAFRFIGKLSTGKTGGWTKDDFTTITIAYDITGVQSSAYDAVQSQLTYGLYKEITGPTLSNATANTADTGVDFNVTFTKGTALTCAFTGLGDGVTLKSVTWGASATDTAGTTTNIPLSGASFTINANMWGSAAAGDVKYIKLTASDNTVFIVKVTIA